MAQEDNRLCDACVKGFPKEWKTPRDLTLDNVIGNIEKGVSIRKSLNNFCEAMAFVSQVEPKNLNEALKDRNWILAMQEELKARLVAKGYNQEEGIDYDETYAPVARLEAVILLLAFSCIKGFKLIQMDVKSAFLNGYINEEVFVSHPPGFEDHQHPEYMFKLKKALYGLKQAPRQWYERLSDFLTSQGYDKGTSDKTLFIKRKEDDTILVQVYVDDIIFGSNNGELCETFMEIMKSEFEISMMGELNYFLGLQIKHQGWHFLESS